MAAVCAYVSVGGCSRVFRSQWSREVQLLELGFFIAVCIHRPSILPVSAPAGFCLACGLDRREKSYERRRSVQRKILLHPSCTSWVDWTSLLPVCGKHGEYCGGDCLYFGLHHPRELATIVFHNVQTPELNKIVMGFLFHRLIIMGRGVTDLDSQTAAAQTALAEATPLS